MCGCVGVTEGVCVWLGGVSEGVGVSVCGCVGVTEGVCVWLGGVSEGVGVSVCGCGCNRRCRRGCGCNRRCMCVGVWV